MNACDRDWFMIAHRSAGHNCTSQEKQRTGLIGSSRLGARRHAGPYFFHATHHVYIWENRLPGSGPGDVF
jgi:hypothetical protein